MAVHLPSDAVGVEYPCRGRRASQTALPFDHSGQNLFISAYHGFYTLGNGHLPVPMTFDKFPPYSINLRNAHVESGTLVIPAVVVLGGEENPGRYRLLAKLQLTTPGKGCHPGMLRNYLADASCDSSVVYIRVPDYASIIGNGSNTCQVHGRFILLDNVTGYRSQYQQKSFLLQIAQ